MTCELDHVNVSVIDLDRTTEFLRIAFPDFWVRGGGEGKWEGGTSAWRHLGIDSLYVSINTTSHLQAAGSVAPDATERTRINHIGFIVADVDDLQAKYDAAGFKTDPISELPSRKRLYVVDADNIMWEFVQYMSDDPAVRNDYSI